MNSEFKFKVNSEAASSNFNTLAKNDFNLEDLLHPEGRCMTSYRSKLKEVKRLKGLLKASPMERSKGKAHQWVRVSSGRPSRRSEVTKVARKNRAGLPQVSEEATF